MMARQLPGVAGLTCPNRYRAGVLVETHLNATVHVLDDGFQHLQLGLDLDLVIVGREDVEKPPTLPGGRLRESLDTLVAADAVLTQDDEVVVESPGLDLPVYRLMRSTPRDRGISAEPPSASRCSPWPASPRRSGSSTTCAAPAGTSSRRWSSAIITATTPKIWCSSPEDRGGGGAPRMILTTEKDYVRLRCRSSRGRCRSTSCRLVLLRPEFFDEFRAWIDPS